jgi:VanZ family protein
MASIHLRFTKSFLWNWIPVILWASLIFVFSTDTFSSTNTAGIFEPIFSQIFPQLPVGDIERIHALIRKVGHFSEYFVLAFLLMRALRNAMGEELFGRRLFLSILIATLYAVSDEAHQSFVPSRSASAVDVSIDSIGAICGTLLSYRRNRRRRIGPEARYGATLKGRTLKKT